MKKTIVFGLLLLMSIGHSQVFMTESGRLEILGLKKWDGKTLIDSMKVLGKGKPLHACAGQMVQDFGFPEVSVAFYEDNHKSSSYYTVVCVIEDNNNGKLKYLQNPPDSLDVLSEYSKCANLIRDNYKVYYFGINYYEFVRKGEIEKAKSKLASQGEIREDVERFWSFLKSKDKISDLNLALWVLNNDSNILNRGIAMAVLSNFNEYDAVWWEIFSLQRDKNVMLRYYAALVLQNFEKNIRKINWEPAVVSINALLNGTNLFLFQKILSILVKTEISPELAPMILAGSTRILNLYLNAEHNETRKIAINFIRQISGNQTLSDAAACKAWLKQYEKES